MPILDVHVPYHARVVKRACRNVSTETFVVRVPVRVPELAPERAPVALRAVLPDGRILVYREINGALARPLVLPLEGQEVPVTPDNAQEALDRFYQSASLGTHLWPFLPEPCVTHGWMMRDGADVRRTVQSTREVRIQAYREAFEFGSAFVEGRLFVPSLGPAWVLESSPEPHVALHPERGHIRPGTKPVDWVFAHDQLDAAVAKAQACLENGRLHGALGADALGETKGRLITRAELAAGVDSFPAEVAATAEAMLVLAAPGLARLPPAAIHAFADLRAIADAGIDADTAEGALMTLRDLHDQWTAFHGGKPPVPGADPVADLLARLAAERGDAAALDDAAGLDGLKALGSPEAPERPAGVGPGPGR